MDAKTEPSGHDVVTAPPKTDDAGIVQYGQFPLNHRMRAEAMARAGVTTDEMGLIGDDLIAETVDRLKVEDEEAAAKVEAAERAKPSLRWTKDQLAEYAGKNGVVFETDANKDTILAAIEAAPKKEA